MYIRTALGILTLLCIATGVLAAPKPAPGPSQSPPPAPGMVTTPAPAPYAGPTGVTTICTASNAALPAPQLHSELLGEYVHLSWPNVPGATGYRVDLVDSNGTFTYLTVTLSQTDFWETIPDLNLAYRYNVHAMPAAGCPSTSSASFAPPYSLPNPRPSGYTHPDETHATISWIGITGATSYRIDGPNIPTGGLIVPGDRYVRGSAPIPGGTLVPYLNGTAYQYTAAVPLNAVATGWYNVTAIYSGNRADFAHPTQMILPRVTPIITSISPTSGIFGKTVVTITGKYLSDPSDGYGPEFYIGATPSLNIFPTNLTGNVPDGQKVSASPTAVQVILNHTGYIKVVTYMTYSNGQHSPATFAASPVPYVGTPPAVTPPPPTIVKVRVPQVQWLPLSSAETLLSQAHLTWHLSAAPTSGAGVVVNSVAPGWGALVNVGTSIQLSTLAAATPTGVSKLTLTNNLQAPVFVWTFDLNAQMFKQWGDSVARSAQTTVTPEDAHTYLVYALDPSQCSDNDPHDSQCWIWEGSFTGASSGPAGSCSMGSPQC